MNLLAWLAVILVLIGLEIATMALTTIWFAVGALAAFFVTMFGGEFWLQIVVFLVVSLVVLIFYRPLAVKYVNAKRITTNVEDLVGKEGKVIEKVSNLEQSGRVVLNGIDWAARATNDDCIIESGNIVKVLKVEGVKLIVEPMNKM